jgi:hypothetical protein
MDQPEEKIHLLIEISEWSGGLICGTDDVGNEWVSQHPHESWTNTVNNRTLPNDAFDQEWVGK